MSTNFHLAPPSKTVDGLLSVPIDIESIDAVFTFDGAAQTAVADATITYTVGPTAGNPFFDLRQNITAAWVDGAVFPVAQLAHHDFGVGTFTNLRVMEDVQAAGSVHTLRVQYDLALPNSQLGGSYLPALDWLSGPKLRFVFGMSDLNRARYAEAWLPANLIFDQYSIDLELQITGTMATHSVITNGAVTNVGTNHWSIAFPSRFTALSPMLEVRSSDTLTMQTDTVVLPVSGNTVTIEAWKLNSVSANLVTEINNIKTFLTENENNYGAYAHGNRFVALFNTGGMEYEGGTTTSIAPLRHETFHSWFARGIKPASQADGWWDEGFTKFHDDGADDAIPFDFTDPPIILCSRDPWQRHTPSGTPSSYVEGNRFWKGIASMIGVGILNDLMSDLYDEHKGDPISTQMIEEHLLGKTGNIDIVDAFHRFIYGIGNPSPVPDLWMRDDPGDPGDDNWGGVFWDSPDLWIRNNDDGGTSHQSPEFGQDNWFYARVRNKAGAGNAGHFVVTFHTRGFLGTQFEFPDDFLPSIAATADFDLAAGDTRIVKAKWPEALIPAAGTHTCLLASIITRSDHPIAGRHVWEDNNLAQKNLEIVDLVANEYFILPIVVRNWRIRFDPLFKLEVWGPKKAEGLRVSLIHNSKEFFKVSEVKIRRFKPEFKEPDLRKTARLECGSPISRLEGDVGGVFSSHNPELVFRRFPDAWEADFSDDDRAALAVNIPPFTQAVVGLKLTASEEFKPKKPLKLHFVQRNVKTDQIVGGVAVQVNRFRE
ncbi:MAG: hypothetical protein ACT4O9_07410 [Blastocatellia bacterium]